MDPPLASDAVFDGIAVFGVTILARPFVIDPKPYVGDHYWGGCKKFLDLGVDVVAEWSDAVDVPFGWVG